MFVTIRMQHAGCLTIPEQTPKMPTIMKKPPTIIPVSIIRVPPSAASTMLLVLNTIMRIIIAKPRSYNLFN